MLQGIFVSNSVFFVWFCVGGCVFWVSTFLGHSGAADCCEKTCSFSSVVFMGFSCMLFCTFLLGSFYMCNSLISVCSTELVVQFLLKDDRQMLRLMCDLTCGLCDQIMWYFFGFLCPLGKMLPKSTNCLLLLEPCRREQQSSLN